MPPTARSPGRPVTPPRHTVTICGFFTGLGGIFLDRTPGKAFAKELVISFTSKELEGE